VAEAEAEVDPEKMVTTGITEMKAGVVAEVADSTETTIADLQECRMMAEKLSLKMARREEVEVDTEAEVTTEAVVVVVTGETTDNTTDTLGTAERVQENQRSVTELDPTIGAAPLLKKVPLVLTGLLLRLTLLVMRGLRLLQKLPPAMQAAGAMSRPLAALSPVDLTTYNQVEQVDLMMYNQADLIMFLHLITSEAMLVKQPILDHPKRKKRRQTR